MYIVDSSKLGALPSWFDMFDLTKHPPPVIETKTPAAKEIMDTTGDTTTTQTIDTATAKALINKYGVILAYQIMKGVKTVAQADAEVAANIAAKVATQTAAQAPGIINTIVSTVKNNWLLFAGIGLLLFGSGLFKSRR